MSKKKTNTKLKAKGPMIYCGPSFNGELQQYSIFKGEIPGHLNIHMENCPDIQKMFYPVTELAKVRSKIKEQGSRENQIYISILEYQKKEVK